MKKWKNPYVLLELDMLASEDEIRKRAETVGNQSEEMALLARSAREALTQNIYKMFPAFLTAVPGLFSMAQELKNLRRFHRKTPQVSEEVLADAFTQSGLDFQASSIRIKDVDLTPVESIQDQLSILDEAEAIRQVQQQAGVDSAPRAEIQAANPGQINIPLLITI